MNAKEARNLANKNRGGELLAELQQGILIMAQQGHFHMSFIPVYNYSDNQAADCKTKLQEMGYDVKWKRMVWNDELLFEVKWFADEEECSGE